MMHTSDSIVPRSGDRGQLDLAPSSPYGTPYRLAELASEDPRRWVYLARDRAEVDALRDADALATCPPPDRPGWIDSDFAEPLRGRRVVIIGRDDEFGRQESARLAGAIRDSVQDVRIIEPPGLRPRQGLCDWLRAGFKVQCLHALAELASSFVPPPPRDVRDEVAPEDPPINRTDLGNARRLIKRHGAILRYCPPWGSWLVWDGRRWQEDVTGQVARLAKQTVRAIGAEAAEADDDGEAKALLQWALKSEAKRQIDALIGLAWSEPGVPVEPGQLNTDPMLLNVANGTLDLRTGALRPHRPEDLITKLAPVAYDPEAACPRWEAFLRRILDDDADLTRFVQRALGYALTGSVAEHVLFFLYGTGRNGKSTLLNVILALLGDYATTVDAGLLTAKRDQDHPTGLTDLDGRRFVPTAEVEDGKRLAEALVKKLTGGERIKARRMRADHYEFEPAHKIFLAANHKPEIKGTDEGIWSRIRLIEFRVFIPPEDRIKDFDKVLIAEEGPGILAWLVRGCLDWQRVGLAEPPAVARATAGYRAEMDALGEFLEDRCDRPDDPALKPRARSLTSTLYHAYVEWSRDNGVEPMTARKFGSEMERRGFPLVKSNGKCWRAGLRVKQPDREGDIERTPF